MKAKTMKIGNKIPPKTWCGSGAGATLTSFLSLSGFFVVVVEVGNGAFVVVAAASVGLAFAGVVASGFNVVVVAAATVETFVAWVEGGGSMV